MRVLAMLFLALGAASPMGAQQQLPAGHRDSVVLVDSGSARARAAKPPLSLRRHLFTGVAVGMLAAGAGFYIEGQTRGYGDCIGCEIVIPIAIMASGAVGGIIGSAVYGLRRLDEKARAREAGASP